MLSAPVLLPRNREPGSAGPVVWPDSVIRTGTSLQRPGRLVMQESQEPRPALVSWESLVPGQPPQESLSLEECPALLERPAPLEELEFGSALRIGSPALTLSPDRLQSKRHTDPPMHP